MAASPQPADPRTAHEAHARIRAIQQRQEQAARHRAEQAAGREAAEVAAQAQAEVARLRARLQSLQDENDALHDRIALLTEVGGLAGEVPFEWGLSPMESRLLAALRRVGNRVLTIDAALVALYQDKADLRCRDMPAILISRIRRKLADGGVAIAIETHERFGYRLSPASIALFDTALTGAPRRNGGEPA